MALKPRKFCQNLSNPPSAEMRTLEPLKNKLPAEVAVAVDTEVAVAVAAFWGKGREKFGEVNFQQREGEA